MASTTKKIHELLEYVDNERLQLPEIQREFVWKRHSVKLLFDSLHKGLPIGQMLVWKTSEAVKHRSFHGRQSKKSASQILNFYGYLLDGQQRLTALARVRDADEDYPLLFDLLPDIYDGWPFFWGKMKPENWGAWVVPVTEVIDPTFKLTEYINRLRAEEDYTDSNGDIAIEALNKLGKILDYDVEVEEFESDDYRQATELFIRFNSTGKRLSSNDLALAELATHVPGLMATDMAKAASQWHPQYDFTRPFLIQCLVAVHTHRMDIKQPRKLWDGTEPHEIRTSWKLTRNALAKVIKILTGAIHWDSASWVPSFNALIPLIYIAAYGDSLSNSDRKNARSWLLLTTMRSHFSGSVYTELDRILRKLAVNPTMEELRKATKKSLGKVKPDEFEVTRRSSPAMSMYISLLRDRNAKSWNIDDSLDGRVLGKGAQLQIHHFFPKALMTKHGYSLEQINSFANLTVISAEDNLDIHMEEPATYLKRLHVDRKQLDIQCIPADQALWHIDRYFDFLEARRELLAQKANEYLFNFE